MTQKMSSTTPTQQNNDADKHITRLVTSGLMKRSQLPVLRIAMKNLRKTQDVARLPKSQRDVMYQYNNALQNAALGSTMSVNAVRKNIMNGVEVESDNIINEEVINENYQPPQVLVLRRTGIRIFPDGMRVAMYSNERLKVKFTVPYSATGVTDSLPNVTAESTNISEESIDENIEHVKRISRSGQPKELKFLDGTSLKVDHNTAKAIHLVHDALNDENKAKVSKMLSHSKSQFLKVADFANKNVSYRIGKHS